VANEAVGRDSLPAGRSKDSPRSRVERAPNRVTHQTVWLNRARDFARTAAKGQDAHASGRGGLLQLGVMVAEQVHLAKVLSRHVDILATGKL
jgi:hypothetical protein